MADWYERRSELRRDQVFKRHDGSVVRLDRTVPGDGTQWYVLNWSNGWFADDVTIEPGDLRERLPDNYAG